MPRVVCVVEQVIWINRMSTFLWEARRDALKQRSPEEYEQVKDLWEQITRPDFAETLGGGEAGMLKSRQAG